MTRPRSLAAAALALLAAAVLSAVPGATGAGTAAARMAPRALAVSSSSPCGVPNRPPARLGHVIWVWMENHSYHDVVGSSSAPYLNGLAARCGLATNFHNTTHPSLPNYLAAVTGSVRVPHSDCGPAQCPQTATTLFAQTRAHGKTWRAYAEGMPAACWPGIHAAYAPKHNPAVYYPAIRSDCRRYDLPMGSPTSGPFASALAHDAVPSFTFLTPDMCHSMHDCSVRTGDTWLQQWMPRILDSASYRSGNTAVFVTWDEGSGFSSSNCLNTSANDCHIATLVISPYTPRGARSGTYFSHFSLLRTAEELMGLPLLGHAGDRYTPSLRGPFRV